MKKKIINTKNAPAPIGPYNQAIKIDNMLFVSGQVAIDPKNNELVQSSISDETDQVMKNFCPENQVVIVQERRQTAC